jgi:hypothetical protein
MNLEDYAGNGKGYMTCAVPGCIEAHYSKRLCSDHYQAWYRKRKRNGYVHPRVTLHQLESALADKTIICNLDGCDIDTHARGLCQKHYIQYLRLTKAKAN